MSGNDMTASEARERIRNFHANMQRRDYFQLLGVDHDSDPERIRASYHELAKRWHADRYADFDLRTDKEKLDEIFQTISEAYETLTNPAKRAEYMVKVERESRGMSTDVHSILRAESIVDEALAALKRRDWATCEERLREAIELNPDDPLYRAHRAWALYHLGKRNEKKVRESVDALKDAVRRQESLAIGYQYLGQIFFARESYPEALRWWKKCLEWDPKNVEASRGIRLINSRQQKKSAGLGGFFKNLFKR